MKHKGGFEMTEDEAATKIQKVCSIASLDRHPPLCGSTARQCSRLRCCQVARGKKARKNAKKHKKNKNKKEPEPEPEPEPELQADHV